MLRITLHNEKCQFGVESCVFYGQIIDTTDFWPKQSKIEDFKNTVSPKDKSEILSFLGKAAYFSKRIIGLAELQTPLKPLTQHKNIFTWEATHQSAFQSIKDSIMTGCLAHFDYTRPTKLFADAGPKGIAAVLTQLNRKDEPVIIAATSHSDTEAQRNYSQIDKELFASV